MRTLPEQLEMREGTAPRVAVIGQLCGWGLLVLAFWSVVRGFSSGVLETGSLFTSDKLYLPALYRDLFREGGHLSAWHLTPAPYFFPDWPLYFGLEALLGDFRRAVAAYGAAQVVLLAFAVQALARAARPRHGRELGGRAVLAVAACLLLYSWGHFYLFDAVLISAVHGGSFVLCLAAWAMTARALSSDSRRALALLGATALLASLSDALFVVTFAVPAAATLALLGWRRRYPRRNAVRAAAVALCGSGIGCLLARVVTSGQARVGPATLRGARAVWSLRQLGRGLEAYATGPTAAVSLLAVVALGWAGWHAARALRGGQGEAPAGDGRGALGLFLLIASATNVAAVVVTGNFADGSCFRYLLLPLIGVPLLMVSLAGMDAPARARARTVAAAAGLFALIAARFLLGHPPVGSPPWSYVPPVVECLDSHRGEGLERGLSDYWNAKLVSMFSQTGLRAIQVSETGEPQPWISSREWYLRRDPGASRYTFVLTQALDVAALRARFGPPERTFSCGETPVWVYGAGFDSAARADFTRELQRSEARR